MRLTKTVIEKASYEGDGKSRHVLWDEEIPAFGLRVYPSGNKAFVLFYRQDGRQRLMSVGRFGVLTLQQAREKARKALVSVIDGSDPVRQRKGARAAATLADVAERYMEEHARPKKKASSVAGDERLLRLYIIPALGQHKAAAITAADVSQLHHSLRGKPFQANRVLALLSKMFSLAEKWGYRLDYSNPCRHVERYRERKRERFLSSEELARLGEALTKAEHEQTEHPSAILAIRLLLLTGARKNEILSLTWDEVDLQRGYLRLRDSKTDGKVIPLGPPALELLSDANRIEENPYVCHGVRHGQRLVGLQRPWDRIRQEAGLPEVRLHDLRHTHASVAAGVGYGLPIIGKLLGHTQPVTTARYAHLADDPVKEAAARVSREMDQSLNSWSVTVKAND